MLPIVDPGVYRQSQWLGALGTYRRFKRRWTTTTTSNGVEVFADKHYVYPKPVNPADKTKLSNLLHVLGVYKAFENANFQGLDSMWIYLNPAKYTGVLEGIVTQEVLADAIEEEFPLNKAVDCSVLLSLDATDTAATKDYTQEQLYNYCKTNWSRLVSSLHILPFASDLVKAEYIPVLMLFDVSDEFNVIMKSVTRSYTTAATAGTYAIGTLAKNTLVQLTIAIRVTRTHTVDRAVDGSKLITKLLELDNQLVKESVMTQAISTKNGIGGLVNPLKTLTDERVWDNGRLRVDAVEALPIKKRMNFILSLLDQGYQVHEKKSSWWQQALIVVAVIVIAIVTYGWGAAAAGSAATAGEAALAGAAAAAAAAALTLYVVAAVAVANNEPGLAQWASRIGAVVGVISTVLNVANFLTNGLRKLGEEATKDAAEEAAKNAAKEGASEVAQQAIREAVKDYTASNVFNVLLNGMKSNIYDTFMKGLNFLAKLYSNYNDNKLKSIESRNQELYAKTRELDAKRAWEHDIVYATSLKPYEAIRLSMSPLTGEIQAPMNTDLEYASGKFNIGGKGHFQGAGVMSPAYYA